MYETYLNQIQVIADLRSPPEHIQRRREISKVQEREITRELARVYFCA